MKKSYNYIRLVAWGIIFITFIWAMDRIVRKATAAVPVYQIILEQQIDPTALFYTESEEAVQSERKLIKEHP